MKMNANLLVVKKTVRIRITRIVFKFTYETNKEVLPPLRYIKMHLSSSSDQIKCSKVDSLELYIYLSQTDN